MKEYALTRTRTIVAIAGLLWLIHACVVFVWNGNPPGPVLSDSIQFIIGCVLVGVLIRTSRSSEGLARVFWGLASAAYILLAFSQGLSVYNDLAATPHIFPFTNFLFSFWFAPLAMALFLDPEQEAGRLDIVTALDFLQALLVCAAAYLYFFYLPIAGEPSELSHTVWAAYFAGYGIVAAAFLLRSVFARSEDVRTLFGRMGAFLAFSGCIDACYDYGPGRVMRTGQWFDLFWSGLLIIPILIATTWRQAEEAEPPTQLPVREKKIYLEVFHLIYPLLVLIMSLNIARARLGLAIFVVLLSFLCSSARLLVIQHRLLLAREALRREASRDGLTSLWNRKAILGILERELLRAERDRSPVGVIMIDVDHFKAVNDSRGHAAGDTVLRIIASGIAAMVRPYDSVGRYGGEEFLIVASGCGLMDTWELAERVRIHVAECNIMATGSNVKVSLSLGVATGDSSEEMEKLLQDADAALYQAKNAGRNRVEPSIARPENTIPPIPGAAQRDFWI